MKVRGYNVGKGIPVRLSREDIRKAKRAAKAGSLAPWTCPVTQAVNKTMKGSFSTGENGFIDNRKPYGVQYITSKTAVDNIITRWDNEKEVKPCVFMIYRVLWLA